MPNSWNSAVIDVNGQNDQDLGLIIVFAEIR